MANTDKIGGVRLAVEDMTFRYLSECFSLDSRMGILFWKHRPDYHFIDALTATRINSGREGREAGALDTRKNRLGVQIGGRLVRVHRVVYALSRGIDLAEVPVIVDHIDGDPMNNRPDNLRAATHLQNVHNMGISRNNTSGAKGVTVPASGGFVARIRASGRYVHLGTFRSLEEARAAYLGAAKIVQGEFMRSGL